MTFIRLYLTALTVSFFLAVVLKTNIGVLEATVITSVPLFLILDMRADLQSVKSLEKQIAAFNR